MHRYSSFARICTLKPLAAQPSVLLRAANAVFTACVAAIFLAALTGCATIQVHLGMKVYLVKTPVTSIEITQPKGPGIAPGQKSSLAVTVIEPDGKTLLTEGAGHGKV